MESQDLKDEEGHKVHTCDICPKVIFESEEALERHVDLKHRAMMEEINTLLRTPLPTTPGDLSQDWTVLGKEIFHAAAKKDPGESMLCVAALARQQLQTIVTRWNPSAEVFVFGSSLVMGSWDGHSDIDFAVVDPKAFMEGSWPPDERQAVRTLADILRNAGFQNSSVECVDSARVPIVKHKTLHEGMTCASTPEEKEAMRTIKISIRSQQGDDSAARAKVQEIVDRLKLENPDMSVESLTNCVMPTTTDAVRMTLLLNEEFAKLQETQGMLIAHARPYRVNVSPEVHRVDFDLCLRQFGIRNSEFLRRYHADFPNSHYLRAGSVVLKQWSKTWGINNSFMGFLTSYAVNIMWIYFLVRRGVVPYVSPDTISPDPSIAKREPQYIPLVPLSEENANPQKMGELMVDFFKYYANEFDWANHVVSLNRPEITLKSALGWLPENEVKLSRASKNVRYEMCIEDPYETNLNLGRHLGICKSRKIKSEFIRAFQSLLGAKEEVKNCVLFAVKDNLPYIPVRDPPSDAYKTLQSAIHTLYSTGSSTSSSRLLLSSDVVRRHFETTHPEAFAIVQSYWKWRTLIRRLGYRHVGDKIEKRTRFVTSDTQQLQNNHGFGVSRKGGKSVASTQSMTTLQGETIVKICYGHSQPKHPYAFFPKSPSVMSVLKGLFRV
eukprot:PhF_6_TR40169/c0_g1_i2/m.59521